MTKNTPKRSAKGRSTARLAACQALYELEMSGATPDSVLIEFMKKRWSSHMDQLADDEGGEPLAEPDAELFTAIVRGVVAKKAQFDSMIEASLEKGWTVEKLDVVLRAIMRAGAFELLDRPDVPPKVVISEYVDAAKAFFTGGEPGMTNGVLDRLARTLRNAELGDGGGQAE